MLPFWIPQWSPPVIGGSTESGPAMLNSARRPQWSPPVIGGSIRQGTGANRLRCRTAMEPASDRREHADQDPGVQRRRRGTAMEPPLIGRSTAGMTSAWTWLALPQWSPPVFGGSIAKPGLDGALDGLAAMEPAGDRRETWDLPDQLRVRTRRTAMESAGYRREHELMLLVGDTARIAAMEPAVYRREHQPYDRGAAAALSVPMEPANYRRERWCGRTRSCRSLSSRNGARWLPQEQA
jgi:hypothetical protein